MNTGKNGWRFTGVLLLQLAFAQALWADGEVAHYETQSGLWVSRIKSVSVTEESRFRQPVTEVVLSNQKAVDLIFPSDLSSLRVYQLSHEGAGISSTPFSAQLADYLGALPALSYDPSQSHMILAQTKRDGLEVVAFDVERVDGARFTLRVQPAGEPFAFDAGALKLIQRVVGIPKAAPEPVDAQELKRAFFLKARNHPSPRSYIEGWTTPRPARARSAQGVYEDGVMYSGVLKSAGKKTVVVTLWTGDTTFAVRGPGASGEATELLEADSPKNPDKSSALPFGDISLLKPGQFVTIYALKDTLEADQIVTYRRADP